MKNKWIKVMKIILIIVIVIVVLAVLYIGYAFLTFRRIGDISVTPEKQENFNENSTVSIGETYRITTSNLGFGAYSSDFDFFMDGGKGSWAKSEEAVNTNISGIVNRLKQVNPDFCLMQEIDRDSTRSYHIDELELINSLTGEYTYTFAYNLYKSPFYVVPVYKPHGTITAGLATFSKFPIESSNRVELKIMSSIVKLFDLDRCYTVTRIPTSNGKLLCIYNVHLSAYGSDDSVRDSQTNVLVADMQAEYDKGNYIICGGDFNHELTLPEDAEGISTWAYPFPRHKLPENLQFAMDIKGIRNSLSPTGRDTDAPYVEGVNKTFVLDGFIVSDNVEVEDYYDMTEGFLYSDHEPVFMSFYLK